MSATSVTTAILRAAGIAAGETLLQFGDDFARFTAQYGDDIGNAARTSEGLQTFLTTKADEFKLAGYSDDFLKAFASSADDIVKTQKSVNDLLSGYRASGATNFDAYLATNGGHLDEALRDVLKMPHVQANILKAETTSANQAFRVATGVDEGIKPSVVAGATDDIVRGASDAVKRQARIYADELAAEGWKASKGNNPLRKGSFSSSQPGEFANEIAKRFPDLDSKTITNLVAGAVNLKQTGGTWAMQAGKWTLIKTAQVAAPFAVVEGAGRMMGFSPLGTAYNVAKFIYDFSKPAEPRRDPTTGEIIPAAPGGLSGLFNMPAGLAEKGIKALESFGVSPEWAKAIVSFATFGVMSLGLQMGASITGADKLPFSQLAIFGGAAAAAYGIISSTDTAPLNLGNKIQSTLGIGAPSPTG